MAMKRLTLMRHGSTGQPSYRGRIDDPLDATGWRQSYAAVADRDWDIVISSTLRRCSEFSSALADARTIRLQLDERLVEYDFGAWQGVRIDQLEREQPVALARYRADPQDCPPPRGEDFARFGERITTALDAAAASGYERILVLTHGAVIRWVQCRLAGLPFGAMAETSIANASLHEITWLGAAVGLNH
jgi:alpha-ribazole phosphatase